jgi:hypothetical protein
MIYYSHIINENKIILNKDYSQAKVTCDTFIEGKCITLIYKTVLFFLYNH